MRCQRRCSRVAAALFAALLAATSTLTNAAEFNIVAKEYLFTPIVMSVSQDEEVTIVFSNQGMVSHSLTFPELGIEVESIQTGTSQKVQFTAEEPGTSRFYCTVPGHKEIGMVGLLTVAR